MALKPGYFCRQSGVVPYRLRKGKLEVFLITSRSNKRWIIPKGIIERNYSARNSAAKEALEEAGIEGRLGADPLGTYTYEKWGGVCTVELFAMEVLTSYDVWPESYRDRIWFSPAEAAERVNEPELKRIILEFEPAQPDK